MSAEIGFRRARAKDVPMISRSIARWLVWKIPREGSIRRAIKRREILVAYQGRTVIGYVHSIMHEDIIDGGTDSFITCLYVAPPFRNKGVGSSLLKRAMSNAIRAGAVGVKTSTASPDARRFYEAHGFRQFKGDWAMGEVFLEFYARPKPAQTSSSEVRTAKSRRTGAPSSLHRLLRFGEKAD
jgi:GNAT superfamily N-acetyltransferase